MIRKNLKPNYMVRIQNEKSICFIRFTALENHTSKKDPKNIKPP